MKIITLDGGKTYLADNVETGKVVKAVEVGSFDKSNLVKYLKKKNLGELTDIEISEAVGYTVTDLTPDQEKEVNRFFKT